MTRSDPEALGRAIADSPLLLHSLADFGELPLEALSIAGVRSVVEVGGQDGAFTRMLTGWAAARGARVACVDPSPGDALRALADAVELVEDRSPQALAALGPFDAYVLDGDHNYDVVSRELACVPAGALVLVHDVGWPCARRDFYFDPSALAPEAVHPHSFDGHAVPGSQSLAPAGGLAGRRRLAAALRSGGERNGVLTAVEDFVAAREGWELAVVPCLYGLAFVFPAAAPWAPDLRAHLAPFAGSDLLATLEANRLALVYRLAALGELSP